MPNPTGYTPDYSFSDFQESTPTTPLPADRVDDELANISQSIASLRSAVMNVRRSDGALKNLIVTYDSLAPDVRALLAEHGIGPDTIETIAAYVKDDLSGAIARNTGADDTALAAAGVGLFGRRERPMIGNYPIVLGGACIKQDIYNNGSSGYSVLTDGGDESDSWVGWTSIQWALPGVGDTGTPKYLIPFFVQDIPVDVRDGMIVLHVLEVQNVNNSPTGSLDRLIINLYSEGEPDALASSYHQNPYIFPNANFAFNHSGKGWFWHKFMIPVNQFVPISGGADLTHIRFATIGMRAAFGATVKIRTGLLQFVPNALDKAKCIWRVDDGKKGHYVDMAREFAKHGWPLSHHMGAVAETIRDDDNFFLSTYAVKQMHDYHGHQLIAPVWDSELQSRIDGLDDTGKIAWMARARAWMAANGLSDSSTSSYQTELAPAYQAGYEMFRTHYAELLLFETGDSLPSPAPLDHGEMYPWGDHMRVRCHGIDPEFTGRTENQTVERVKAHINQAIANKGVAILALHDYYALQNAIPELLDWLETKRDVIDVCTIQDIKDYPRRDLLHRQTSSLILNPVYPAPQRVPLNGRICAIGDDVLADAWDDPSDGFGSYKSTGILAYLLSGLGAKLYMPPGGNLAAYAQTVAQTANAGNLNDVIDYNPKIVVLSAGARSVYESVYETQDFLRSIYDTLNAAGIIVVHGTPLPDDTLDDTGEAHRQILRRFIRSRKSPLMIPVDLENLLDWSTVGMATNLLPNTRGALAIGDAYAAAIEPLLEQADVLSRMNFEHTDNTALRGGTTTATGWTLDSSNAGGATVTPSKHAEPGGNAAQRIVISGNYSGDDKSVILKQDQTTGLPDVGDIVEGLLEIEVPSSMTRIISVSVAIRLTNDDFSFRGYCDSLTGSTGNTLSTDFDGPRRRFRTPAFAIPDQSGKTLGTITTEVTIRFTNAASSSAVAGTFDIWRAGIRDVPANS